MTTVGTLTLLGVGLTLIVAPVMVVISLVTIPGNPAGTVALPSPTLFIMAAGFVLVGLWALTIGGVVGLASEVANR